ncbi:MAG: trypsin-like peptidase domain-containing protein [Crocinitomicaceae bacterium]|nr:trypsin-like peptidase domain-containing protein [Crocinitomicaceae bacterium]
MKKIYTLTLGALFGVASFAQTVDLGGPFSWRPKVITPKFIDTRSMPGYDQAAIDAEDLVNDQTKEGPWRFGYKYETDFSLSNSGTWTTFENGNRLWQLELVCDGAMTVNLIFENLFIPDGAYIYLYDVAKSNRVGAYTNRNNNSEKMLGTELVHGDHIVVEYFEPASVNGQGTFTIANVIHGYRSLNAVQGDLLKAFESSGNCNVDVNCTLGDGWENEIRSVAMIVVGGSGICTGALINNTCDDGTPYFLTANHCVGGGSTASWAFRFNWESPPGTEICQTTGASVNPGPPYDQTANGATQLYTSAASDVALLQITNMTLTDAQNWNCYYAGWDNTDALTVTQGTGIHHPAGDLKKICREDNALTHDPWNGAACWKVTNWDQGVTEGGSSGSPLFDQNHRIIGQLYGGGSACSGTNDNNQPDYYGRFGVSWPNIDNWLAPASCGVTTTNDGWDPVSPPANDDAGITSVIAPTGNYCTNTFDPVVTLRNYGANTLTSVTINYDIDGGTNNTFSWTGTLASGSNIDVTLPTMTTAAGAHTFNVSTSTPNTVADSNPANDDAASNYNATIGGELVTLVIDTDCWGYETAWQILDVSNAVVQEGGNVSVVPGGNQGANSGDPGAYGDESTITESFCLAIGCYDLVVYDDWGDGMNGTGCPVDGSYELTDASSNVLAAMITSSFGDSETQNFCITPNCTGTAAAVTVPENCFDNCDGSITVNVTGGTGPYTYDMGAGVQSANVFSGLCQGSYNITIEDGLGCIDIITVNLTGPSEIIGSATSTNETLGNDGSINLTASGGTGTLDYSWTGPGGFSSTSQYPSGLVSGTYAVTITDDNGCSTTITNIFVGSSLGLNETNALQFSVYPNPSNSIFNVDLGNYAGSETQLVVRDVTGRIIQVIIPNEATIVELNLGETAPGTYYLTIVAEGMQATLTLVKTN